MIDELILPIRGLFMRLLLLSLTLLVAAGCGTPSFLITPVANTNKLEEIEVQSGAGGWSQPKIALIEVEGMLANARTGGFLQPTENKLSLFTQQMEVAARDPRVRAVVLRINSPGGTVTATDTMYQIVQRFREQTNKPVIVSMQEIAASGGYYVACGADVIVAHPTSVVGSIGVIFSAFEFEQGLAKIGVRSWVIKSGEYKDMGSPFKALRADERDLMQQMVDEYHKRFVETVQKHRSVSDVETATDGRVFSGETAMQLGLVDRVGLLDDAIDIARDKARAPGAKVVMYKRPFGYRGSIYASSATPEPQSNVLTIGLPDGVFLPKGFYYIWQP
jgi:protease IV